MINNTRGKSSQMYFSQNPSSKNRSDLVHSNLTERFESSTCSTVGHQVEDVSRFGVNVETDVHVVLGQVDNEVRVVLHCRR